MGEDRVQEFILRAEDARRRGQQEEASYFASLAVASSNMALIAHMRQHFATVTAHHFSSVASVLKKSPQEEPE